MLKWRAVQHVVAVHDEWRAKVRQVIEYWIVTGRRLGVVRDMRIVVARMMWEERHVWSGTRIGWKWKVRQLFQAQL
jgi:hypothetical protein